MTMPDLLLYPLDEFADFMRDQAKALDVSLAKLVREAAERQLAKGTPLPPIGMRYTQTARVSVLRVRAPAELVERIEADAERQGIELQSWIEVAVIQHCAATYREGIKAHENAARACCELHAAIVEQFASFENHGGWPGMYATLKARASA
ncbi:MAG: hypothetical protein JWN04_4206 [Myxococcaceae bacterium]|nr:hypothetical protein [Myxococcaceae bacterium]